MNWQKDIVRFFWPYIKIDRFLLVGLCLLNIIRTGANAVLIWKLGTAISQITNGEFDLLNQTLLLIAGIVFINQIIRLIYAYIFNRMSLRFVDRVRGHLLSHIMSLSFPINHHFEKGDLLTRLTSNVDSLLFFEINAPINLFQSSMVLIVYSTILIWIDWQLALIALAMAPMFFLSQHYVAPKTGEASRHFVSEKAKLFSIEEQVLANLKNISVFNSETTMRDKHKEQFDVARHWALKVRAIRILYESFFTLLLYAAGVFLVFNGISSIESGQISVGILVSFLIYIRNLTGPVRILARMPIQFQAKRPAAERVMAILQMQPSVIDFAADKKLNIQNGTIHFDDVLFSYSNDSTPIFRGLSETINSGESVALVGRSGTGKSTLASLLLRFYDPEQGNITIDGIDIKSISIASLREQISIVLQQPLLVNDTIAGNMRLAKSNATMGELVAACKSSFSWEFIEKLPDGLDTKIGTGGTTLSAGQTQRLAIAQAFLRDTPILILDEATSSLDSYSEQMFVEALQALRQNRTTLIIAHRFSSIRTADRILYFNGNGSITSGTHEHLMGSHADYKNAVEWQVALP
jgi:ABC-type multidrug transport system fused ATPase/permease subunit